MRVLSRQAKGRLRFLDASHIKVHQDGANPAGGQQNQAIGRIKGGLNTKLTAMVDTRGRALSLSLAPGQSADVKVAAPGLPKLQTQVVIVADKAYNSNAFRSYLRQLKARVYIPSKSNRLSPHSPMQRHSSGCVFTGSGLITSSTTGKFSGRRARRSFRECSARSLAGAEEGAQDSHRVAADVFAPKWRRFVSGAWSFQLPTAPLASRKPN